MMYKCRAREERKERKREEGPQGAERQVRPRMRDVRQLFGPPEQLREEGKPKKEQRKKKKGKEANPLTGASQAVCMVENLFTAWSAELVDGAELRDR